MKFTREQANAIVEAKMIAMKKSFFENRKGQFGTEDSAEVISMHKSQAKNDVQREFQNRADDLYIVSQILGVSPKSTKMYKSFSKFMSGTSELKKAMDTVTAGSGLEWVPTNFSNELINMVQIELRVASLFSRVAMPTDPFVLPVKSAFSTARLGGQGVTPSGSKVTTGNVTLKTAKIIDYVPVAYELDEDSIVAMLPLVKEDIANSIARAWENITLNGDDTATHFDSDVTLTDDQLRGFKGLRKLSVANGHTFNLSTFNSDKLSDMITAMGKYGASPSKLAWIVGTKGLGKFRTLKDAEGNNVFTSIDKVGPKAVIVSGMVGELYGSPVIPSEFVRENVNASGIYDGITTDKAVIHLVRTDGFVYGDRRTLLVEQFRDIKSQTIDLVASARVAFSPRYNVATEAVVMTGINI